MPQNKIANTAVTTLLIGVCAIGFLVTPVISGSAHATTLSQLRTRSASLQEAIDSAASQQKKLAHQASSLKNTIASLDADIKQAAAKIELTQTKVKELEIELDKTQKELDRQKELLKASMRALYKRGDASTVELIVGSDSFSEFMDEQEYLERVKLEIQTSAEKVVQLKLQIQAKKEEQEKLLAQQEAAKHSLANARSEKSELLAETKGEEAAFRSRKARLIKQQEAIFREMLRRSSNVIVGGGSYPWSNAICGATGSATGPCWNYEWHIGGNYRDPWGYFYRNCTSYVAWRVNKNGYSVPGLGNGGAWYYNAPGYARGHTPKVGAAASFAGGSYGHVAYVEEVYGNGQIRISEYNFVQHGVYSERVISAGDVTGYVYPWKL